MKTKKFLNAKIRLITIKSRQVIEWNKLQQNIFEQMVENHKNKRILEDNIDIKLLTISLFPLGQVKMVGEISLCVRQNICIALIKIILFNAKKINK